MEHQTLNLYRIDMKYIRSLAKADHRVYSVSPQINKSFRPHLGIIVICNSRKYCIPLTSPKPKHKNMADRIDFSRIMLNGVLIGALNFSRMIPVELPQMHKIDLKIRQHDGVAVRKNKESLRRELQWCCDHEKDIINKAKVLYEKYNSGEFFHRRSNCLDFPALEIVCDKYNST